MIMKRLSLILALFACVAISSSCSDTPLSSTAPEIQQIVFPEDTLDPNSHGISPPPGIMIESRGNSIHICWCDPSAEGMGTTPTECPYAYRIYRAIDHGDFELIRVLQCIGYNEDMTGVRFEKAFWYVTCVSSEGAESDPSAMVSIKRIDLEGWQYEETDIER